MGLKNIDFYYFSGTGNTLLVVEKMQSVFVKNGIDVNLYRIEESNPSYVDLNKTIGLGFPVAAQSTYPFVWDFIMKLPEAQGTEAFMVDTLAAFSGAIVGPLKRFLKKKGYRPIGAREIPMPSNWLPGKIDEDKKKAKIAKGLEKADRYAIDLINGKARWRRIPILSDVFFSIVKGKFTWKYLANFGKRFTVNRDICTKCELCVKICPADNIGMNEFPRFSDRCQQCMRCISLCPAQAIYVPGKKYAVYRAINAQDLLKYGGRSGL